MKKMSFQTKLMSTYAAFIAILMLFLGFGFYYYNAYIFEKNAHASLRDMAVKMSQQLDNCIQPMDFLAMDVISRADLVGALADLTYLDRDNVTNTKYIKDSIQTIKSNIIRDSVNRIVYRLNIFNVRGDFFTSNYNVMNDNPYLMQHLSQLEWIRKARSLKGHKYLTPPHKDLWGVKKPAVVFSLIRVIRDPGNEIGFIEVQNTVDKLTKICSIGVNKSIHVLVIDDDKNIVFADQKVNQDLLQYYFTLSQKRNDGVFEAKSSLTGLTEIISKVRSLYTDWTLLVIQDRKSLLEPLTFIRRLILLVGFILIIITFIFCYLLSRQLTRPLKELKNAMEKVNIENLPYHLNIKNENNEIESLNRSFHDMRVRLDEAIHHEIKSRSLQLRAHFDALQAQINPHFMYNMMNVLANMGLEAGSDEISDTSRRIAAMLRYSTSTDTQQTTIQDEINHVENYLHLMKKRFEHKLEYEIEIDPNILQINIPKLILQPLVENSIYHGFDKNPHQMKISIIGTTAEHEWQINIIDNGSGFTEEILKDLELKIKNYVSEIYANESTKGLSIGGMGIISTFARLKLFYGSELRFIIKNSETGGACISIGGIFNIPVQGGRTSV